MARHGRSCCGGIRLHNGDRYIRKMLELLTIGERDGTCPKIAQLRPPVEGRQPLRLAIEANKLPTGLIALMALLALILFGVAPAVYHPVGLTPGLS
jgi:hypothetical protein